MIKTLKRNLVHFFKMPILWYLLIIIMIAAAVRTLNITKAAIWHDEGYSAMLISLSPGEIITHAKRDFHPPLFHLALHFWSLLFGTSALALRSLSLMFGVATVILVYFITKRLRLDEITARLATLFAAIAPFLVRYSQEARMYGMATFLVCAATLAMLIALDYATKNAQQKQFKWWLIYGLLMAAALYAHYYTGFMVLVHLGYSYYRLGGLKKLLTNKAWWSGNLLAAGLFGLWAPNTVAQFSRVQQGYWIPSVNAETIPNTLMQFLAFASNELNGALEFLITLILACVITIFISKTTKAKRATAWFVIAWMTVPPLVVLLISIVKQPVYYDRYFIYSAVAFSLLLAIMITTSRLKTNYKTILAVGVILLSLLGINGVSQSATHQMNTVANFVNHQAQPDDLIISGELYTYFDFSYYNQTGKIVHLLSQDKLISTGESSLIYDKQAEVVFHNLQDINQTTAKRVWLIGKTGQHDYDSTLIPNNWQLVTQTEAGDSAVRLFVIQR